MSLKIVHFKIDDKHFGIDIMEVQEIVSYIRGVVLPVAHPALDSIIQVRGNIIPVINLRKKFGIAESLETKDRRIIILHTEVGLIGLGVDRVKNIMTLGDKDIAHVPKLFPTLAVKIVDSIGQVGGELLLLLKTATLFNDVDIELVSTHSKMSIDEYENLMSDMEGKKVSMRPDGELVEMKNFEKVAAKAGETLWSCPKCGKRYKSESWGHRHMKKEHVGFLSE
jgi:purine-binding chemotaxis protein CheW